MSRLLLDRRQIKRLKTLAGAIARQVHRMIDRYSSFSVERTVLRLYGVDGVDPDGTPLANRVVDIWRETGDVGGGISRPFAAATLISGENAQTTAEQICAGKLPLPRPKKGWNDALHDQESTLTRKALAVLDTTRQRKKEKRSRWKLPPQPWRYLIVATGNVYEDRTQALAAALAGADIIAQIRSTAQSLLDYVPYGPTTEGVGGTFATQANFRIMRETLDEASETYGRYIRLVNYSSGLCMAEIAACAAFEDLDILLNDAMYGILFRDINMRRTFIDQYFSRLICARAGIMINTGEDNYLTTADAVEQAYTVTASQLINEALAKRALLTDNLLGLGHAFEIDPTIEDGFLYELAHALLARSLFPEAPLKYMPPTKHKSPDIFFAHAQDTLFNLASIMTGQGIHLAGMPTEAIHTPFMQDRFQSLGSINYVFQSARHLAQEFEFKADGLVVQRARKVLDEAEAFLKEIHEMGLAEAIRRERFAGIGREPDGGKGLDGVFKKGPGYSNPIMTRIQKDGIIHG